jgi:NADH dehydrogenase FAD-containing subunit
MARKPRVVVVGGGFAGLESAFYLRHKLQDRVDITLISDSNYFFFKPDSIYIPFGKNPEELRIDLIEPTRRKNIDFIRGKVERIDPTNWSVHLPHTEIAFDYLVLATGAAMRPAEVPGLRDYAVTIWTPEDMLQLRERYALLVQDARAGRRSKLLFLMPPNNRCPGPLYEMALMTDTWLREQGVRDNVDIFWSTFEDNYAQAFGPRLQPVIHEEFETRGIHAHRGFAVDRVELGVVKYANGETLSFDLLVAFPPHVAANEFNTLPTDERGFIKVDPDSRRVVGHERIFAVGDAADFPVKQAFLALLQADAAAEHIAAAILQTEPELDFDPMNIYVMEQLDKAMFAQVPLRYTIDPSKPVTVDLEDEDHYKVGVSPVWRAGKRVVGAYLPWRFGHGEPFHAGLGWDAVKLGLKMMSKLAAR